MFSKAGRISGGNNTPHPKSKFSVKCVVITIGFLSILWCLYIAERFQNKGANEVVIPSKTEIKYPTDSKKEKETLAVIPSENVRKDPHLLSTKKYHAAAGDIHVVFSTDCTFYQDWQTLMVFHSAIEVGQEGPVTRIASGCSDTQKKTLTELYAKLYPQYHVHFTPDFKTDKDSGESYEFYNKPYGVEHWLGNAEPPVPNDVVIAIIDPDMIFMRPISTTIKEDNTIFIPGSLDIPPLLIKKGVPAAQMYGLGAPWAKETTDNFNRTDVCGQNSPCMDVNEGFGSKHYSVGPPYLLETSDLKRLVKTWAEFVPRVFKRYPELLAEMYAYSMAGAHEKLPHFTMLHFMISNTHASEEGWAWVDALGYDVCQASVLNDKKPRDTYTGISQRRFYPEKPLPTLLHMCQFFRAGELGFHKKRIMPDVFHCDSQMLVEPPSDLGRVNYKNRDGEIVRLTGKQGRRNAFSINVAHRSINSMLEYYKNKMCLPGTFIETNKSINVVHWPNDKTAWS